MKKRNRKVSIRTTEEIERLLNERLENKKYKYLTKSDLINMILEENLLKYTAKKN